MTLSKRQVYVFLIYAHGDKDNVHNLYTNIAKNGIEAWLDAEKLLPGQDWDHEIRKAIIKSQLVIVCLSKHFNKQKGYRHEELKIALEKAALLPDGEIFIIPARLEKCDLPKSLSHLHRVDLFEANGYKKLMHALRKHIASM